jgi:hypothetical protein
MSSNDFFCHLDSSKMADFIQTAERAVVYAAPSIHTLLAQAMREVSLRLDPMMLTVSLDMNEHVLRMGYGDIDAIQLLSNSGISINNSPHLRTALLIVDDQGFSFTPTALYLEAESSNASAYNAIRLTPEQVTEALARLSPVAKSIALAQAVVKNQPTEELERLTDLPVIDSNLVDDRDIQEIKSSLEAAPPIDFDIARQVRVYESYLQYVDLKLKGTSFKQRRITIPQSFQKTKKVDDVRSRLRTSFDLIPEDSELLSTSLDDEIKEIRKRFIKPLGNGDSLLLKEHKSKFESRIASLEQLLGEYQTNCRTQLQGLLDRTRDEITKYYLNILQDSPPDDLCYLYGDTIDDEMLKRWITMELDKVFPLAEQLTESMKVDVQYKDVTFETLNVPDFINAVKKAFPLVNWDKAHKEFTAAAQR